MSKSKRRLPLEYDVLNPTPAIPPRPDRQPRGRRASADGGERTPATPPRPRRQRMLQVQIYVTAEHIAGLDRIVEQTGRTRSDLAREAIDDYLARR